MVIAASPTLKISEPQVKYIKGLVDEKPNWTDLANVQSIRVIKLVTRAVDYDAIPSDVSRKLGSATIDELLKLPKPATTPIPTDKHNILNAKAAAQAAIADMPASYKGLKYAIKNTDPKSFNLWVFYEIKEYKGQKYLNRLQGAPGDWNRQFVKYADYAGIAQRIKDSEYVPADTGEHLVGPMAAAARFSDTYQVCSACGAKLSNGKSLADKFGPVCIKKF